MALVPRVNPGKLRHIVDVMRPPTDLDSRGQLDGNPKLVRGGARCSIETLTGREAEQVHSQWPTATYKVEMRADAREITSDHYLTGGTLKTRRLNIDHVENMDELGFLLRLLCSEAKS